MGTTNQPTNQTHAIMAPSASSPAPSSFHPAALPPFKRHVRTPSKSMQRFARKRRASSLSVARPVPQPPAALQPAPAAVDAAQAEASSSSSSSAAEEHNFSCRICLSVPEGPVVTPCGHLACWKCLYSWLAMHPHAPSCPVCKAHCAMHDVLPIYGAGLEEKDPKAVPVPKPKPSQPSAGSRRSRPSFNSLPCFADFCDSAPLPLLQQLGVLLALCLLSMLSSGPPLPIGGSTSSSTTMSEI